MRLAIFDLDFTIWQPEMYQLSSAPKLTPIAKLKSSRPLISNLQFRREARTHTDDSVLVDRSGSIMRVFDGASYALLDIHRLREEEGHDLRVAVASKTDEPRWARICLDHLVISDHDDSNSHTKQSLRLADCIDDRLIEIYYGSKVEHIRNLQKKTGVPFSDMCFFDNEHWNIKDVSQQLPEVKCFYTPDGMTRQAWEDAKKLFGLC